MTFRLKATDTPFPNDSLLTLGMSEAAVKAARAPHNTPPQHQAQRSSPPPQLPPEQDYPHLRTKSPNAIRKELQ